MKKKKDVKWRNSIQTRQVIGFAIITVFMMVSSAVLQMDFFNDRKLTFLESPEINISEYERREALLSVKERLQTITGVSRLIESGILCLPESDYWITSSGIRRISAERKALLEQ